MSRVAVALLGAVSLVAVSACAAPTVGSRPWAAATVLAAPVDLPDDPAALTLLTRAARSALTASYDAVIVSTSPDSPAPVRLAIAHRPGIGTSSAPEDGSRPAQLTPDDAVGTALPVSLRLLDLLVSRFGLALAGQGEVLSRPADVVEAADARGVVEARFWLDRTSGLMVKRELIDPTTGATRATEFVSLTVPAKSELRAATTQVPAAGPALDAVAVARLRSEGWICPEGLPGGLSFVSADEAEAGAEHLVYSDGLDVVSLFVQKGHLDTEAMPGLQSASGQAGQAGQAGQVLHTDTPVPTWVWQSSGSVVTLMTEAPRTTVERIISAVPPDSA